MGGKDHDSRLRLQYQFALVIQTNCKHVHSFSGLYIDRWRRLSETLSLRPDPA